VAALSFTNVAQNLIAERLGGRPGTPHFVGTLDSFVWRFVVRPFGHLAGVRREGAHLIPGPVGDALRFDRNQVQVGPQARDQESLFRISLWGGTESDPKLAYKPQYADAPTLLPKGWDTRVLVRKRQEWARTGRVTHSDCQYIAASILNGSYGRDVSNLLASRFPELLVDEAQDTGWFLARVLHALVANEKVRAVVAGDPDQGIYGFAGQRPELFDALRAVPGARTFSLRESHRCSSSVSAVASALSRSGARISSRAPISGVALLLVHRDSRPVPSKFIVDTILSTAERHGCRSVAILTRKSGDAASLGGVETEREPPVTSRAAKSLFRAAKRLAEGDSQGAAHIASGAVGELLLEESHITDSFLAERGIALRSWRVAVGRVLLASASHQVGETWRSWMMRLRACIEEQALWLLGELPSGLGSRMKCGSKSEEPRVDPAYTRAAQAWKYMTVHKAKGLEFDLVAYYAPQPGRRHLCPSEEWWSPDPTSEEREIAFVAATRAKSALILCVHADTFAALESRQPAFVRLFDVLREPERDEGAHGPRARRARREPA
jgi:DNA helicase-2/ATP-dependent DNA helicase PcrA